MAPLFCRSNKRFIGEVFGGILTMNDKLDFGDRTISIPSNPTYIKN